MKKEEIELAVKEAERFIAAAKKLLNATRTVTYTSEIDGTEYYNMAPKESGATRRASLDLTRQLAQMRKP